MNIKKGMLKVRLNIDFFIEKKLNSALQKKGYKNYRL